MNLIKKIFYKNLKGTQELKDEAWVSALKAMTKKVSKLRKDTDKLINQ